MTKLDDLDLGEGRIDDRWTLHKLRQAGYDLEWERTCRTCGDEIEGYRRLHPASLLVLNAVILTPHSCEGP